MRTGSTIRTVQGQTERKGRRKAAPVFAALAALVACLVTGRLAYGVINYTFGQEIYGPLSYEWDGTTYTQYGVTAPNEYACAAYALGYTTNEYSQWGAVAFAKLSNESTGGGFYALAQLFSHPATDGGTVTDHGIQPGFWSTAYSLYGHDYVWYAEYTDRQIASAREDLQVILDGGNTGGGGQNTGETTITLTGTGICNSNGAVISAPTVTLSLTGSALRKYQTLDTTVYKYQAVAGVIDSHYQSTSYTHFWWVVSDKPLTVNRGNSYDRKYGKDDKDEDIYYPVTYISIDADNAIIFEAINNSQYGRNQEVVTTYNLGSYSESTGINYSWGYEGTALYGLEERLPENHWPDPPTLPPVTGPTVPEPDPPTTNDPVQPNPNNHIYIAPTLPTPYTPIVQQPTEPTEPTEPTPTPPMPPNPVADPQTQVDVIPWLEAILHEIQNLEDGLWDYLDAILGAMSTHCQHIRDEMGRQADYIVDSIEYYTETMTYDINNHNSSLFQWLGSTLEDDMQALSYDLVTQLRTQIGWLASKIDYNLQQQFDHLESYLKELISWLATKLNFSYEGADFDDTSIVYWLKRIWAKLGGDLPSPVTNPEDTWNWFDQLLMNLLASLLASGSDLVSDVADTISQFTHRFPFSIPWDIAAVLGAFSAAPITPEAHIPIEIDVLEYSDTLDIDLHWLDTTMYTVRLVEKLIFIGYLAFLTTDMVKNLDWGA